jgi:prolyl-tRNA editing enzyme YbaK/EbsC (Cys-tRNA(Pro) deacylase)
MHGMPGVFRQALARCWYFAGAPLAALAGEQLTSHHDRQLGRRCGRSRLLRVSMRIGSLDAEPALGRPDLLAPAVETALKTRSGGLPADVVGVAEIDPAVADTAAFCERYGISPGESANCVVVTGRRDGETRYAACVVLATTRADVNGVVRRQLDVRKASFAATDAAVEQTGMEYGGITPLGLPETWPVFIDAAVAATPLVVIGSGVRRSKLVLPGELLRRLPGAKVLDGLGHQVP